MTKRFFNGSREGSRLGAAAKMKKLELQKGGKLPISSQERYKMMMEEKLAEHRSKGVGKSSFTPPGAIPVQRTLSKRAEEAMEEIAKRKAAKKEKELRDRVVVQPKNIQFGRIDAKGRVFDIAGNQVLKIDTKKKGTITTMTGWKIGKYKAKSAWTEMLMNDALQKHSPYEIRLRHMEMIRQQQAAALLAQQGGAAGPYGIVGGPYGMIGGPYGVVGGPYSSNLGMAGQMKLAEMYGGHHDGDAGGMDMYQRAGAQVNAHGQLSNNVYGTYVDNVHGAAMDNVWGGMSTNIWGTVDGGSVWGRRQRMWGTGSGEAVKFLKPAIGFIKAMLGMGNRNSAHSRAAFGQGAGVSSNTGRTGRR